MDKLFLHNHLGIIDPLLIKQKAPSFPPHNIYRYDDSEDFDVEVAVAGYSRDELEVVLHKDLLKIHTVKTDKDSEERPRTLLHHGIATRAFELKFKLGNHVKVDNVSLTDGILRVHLVQEIPEEEKPKTFDIS